MRDVVRLIATKIAHAALYRRRSFGRASVYQDCEPMHVSASFETVIESDVVNTVYVPINDVTGVAPRQHLVVCVIYSFVCGFALFCIFIFFRLYMYKGSR